MGRPPPNQEDQEEKKLKDLLQPDKDVLPPSSYSRWSGTCIRRLHTRMAVISAEAAKVEKSTSLRYCHRGQGHKAMRITYSKNAGREHLNRTWPWVRSGTQLPSSLHNWTRTKGTEEDRRPRTVSLRISYPRDKTSQAHHPLPVTLSHCSPRIDDIKLRCSMNPEQ